MAKFRFEPDSKGIQELLKSPEMMSICKEYADNAVAKLGEGYEASTYTGRTRVNASVIATTFKARKENAENNTILKAVGG